MGGRGEREGPSLKVAARGSCFFIPEPDVAVRSPPGKGQPEAR